MRRIRRFNESQHKFNKDSIAEVFQELMDDGFKIIEVENIYMNSDFSISSNPKIDYSPGYSIRIHNNNTHVDEFTSDYTLSDFIRHLESLNFCLERLAADGGEYQITDLNNQTIRINFYQGNSQLDEKDHDYSMIEFKEYINYLLRAATSGTNSSISRELIEKSLTIKDKETILDTSKLVFRRLNPTDHDYTATPLTPAQKTTLLKNFRNQSAFFVNYAKFVPIVSSTKDKIIFKYNGKFVNLGREPIPVIDSTPTDINFRDNPEALEQYLKK